MKIFKFMVLILCLAMFVGSAQGVYPIGITFDTGDMPPDYGLISNGGAYADGSGVWDHDVAALATHFWREMGSAPGYTGPVTYGYAEITVETFSAYEMDVCPIWLVDMDNGINMTFMVGAGRMFLQTGATVLNRPPINNLDGQKHTYAWELNLDTKMVKIFFDGVQQGIEGGYYVGATLTENEYFFGDPTGGEAHHEYWDTWVMGEGVYPEPATICLLGLGGLLLRRRKIS